MIMPIYPMTSRGNNQEFDCNKIGSINADITDANNVFVISNEIPTRIKLLST